MITGDKAVVDHAQLGRPLQVFAELRFAGTTLFDDTFQIARDLPEVHAVFTMAGNPEQLVHINVRDVEDLKRVIDRLRRSGKLVGTKSLMVPPRVVARPG